MLIKNCKLVNGDIVDILIENEKISKIGKNLESIGEIIDAKNNLVMPGIIDAHTHMRDPGLTQKEDFETGTKSAIRGGVTTIVDMPNTAPATTTYEKFMAKNNILKNKAWCDYGLNFGGSRTNNSNEIKKMKDLAISTKIFLNVSTGDMLVEDDKILNEIFESAEIISVHAEGEMVEKAINLAKKHNKKLYLCHISTEEEINMIREAKKNGATIYAEVTPHHLFLNVNDVNSSEENKLLLRTKPELKTKRDNDVLWEALNDGTIDTIGTDHAPHLISEKLAKLTFGMPSVEYSLGIMLKGIENQKISLERLQQLMCENPVKIFGMENKGKIEVGYDADITIIDLDDKKIVEKYDIYSKSGWSPYLGWQLGGNVITTILRGDIVYNKNKFYIKKGRNIKMKNESIAKALLNVGAVKLNVGEPFTFVSGIKSPIYCDNRQMIGYPQERDIIINAFVEQLKNIDFDVVAGTATAGIPWASFIADRMNKAMSYIRGEKKKHGAGKQIEGADLNGKKVIVIEDLISTGKSSIKAVEATREVGGDVVMVISIFSYEFESAKNNFAEKNISWQSLSDFSTLLKVANELKYLNTEDMDTASNWNKDPENWKK